MLRQIEGDEIYRVIDSLSSQERRILISIMRSESAAAKRRSRQRKEEEEGGQQRKGLHLHGEFDTAATHCQNNCDGHTQL